MIKSIKKHLNTQGANFIVIERELCCFGQTVFSETQLETVAVGDFGSPQAAQTLFVIYIRDSIALRFEPFKRMYENGSKIAVNLTCSKGFK